MFRTLHGTLRTGDVVLADRYFSGWFDMALVKQQQAEVVVRKHQLRATDFRLGVRLGPGDQLVCWRKPTRPDWMSRDQYAALPDVLTLREVRIEVKQRGFRTRRLVVVTMAAAAFRAGVSPWTISFKGALQTINNLAPLLMSRISTDAWCEALLDAIATHEVDNRPDRVEPRVVKRRPKPYKLMNQPRRDYKQRAA